MRMTARTPLRLLKCEKGLAALEFALLAPALLALVFGVIVYSIYFTALIGVRQAAAEGRGRQSPACPSASGSRSRRTVRRR
ncbi:TadE/TadG family type IV pilus assembly protein [Novosphingobium resinovorum]